MGICTGASEIVLVQKKYSQKNVLTQFSTKNHVRDASLRKMQFGTLKIPFWKILKNAIWYQIFPPLGGKGGSALVHRDAEIGADGKPSLSAFHRHRFRENWSSLRKVTGVIKVWFDT